MTRVQQEKDIELEGKVFRVKKFTPEVASYWGFKLFGQLAAFGVAVGIEGVKEELPKLITRFTSMKRDEFAEFQRDCLSVVSVKFDLAGFSPLLNSQGLRTCEISNPTALTLTTEAFTFTIQDFFEEWLQAGGMSLESLIGQSGPTSSPTTGSENSSTTP